MIREKSPMLNVSLIGSRPLQMFVRVPREECTLSTHSRVKRPCSDELSCGWRVHPNMAS
jgi:hypothetical protein